MNKLNLIIGEGYIFDYERNCWKKEIVLKKNFYYFIIINFLKKLH